MTEMSLRGVCEHCGLKAHGHDKEKAFSKGGRWHWEYHCPDSGFELIENDD